MPPCHSFVRPSVCPSIGLLTTFSGFCTFADKSLGRNGIELEMQMFPDDLPLANIDADGYCCHFMRSSVRPTIHGLGFVYCIQSAWKKWPTIWHADVSRWLTLSIHGCLWILLLVCLSVNLSVCSFTAFSGGCAFADKSLGTNGIKFGAKEGASHYWEMAVAITCGYGGYLLPLLAAHSSYYWEFYIDGLVQDCIHCNISSANALEILQSGPKPLIYKFRNKLHKAFHFPAVYYYDVLPFF